MQNKQNRATDNQLEHKGVPMQYLNMQAEKHFT